MGEFPLPTPAASRYFLGALSVHRSMCNPLPPATDIEISTRMWLAEIEGSNPKSIALCLQVTAPTIGGTHVVGVDSTVYVTRSDGQSVTADTPVERDELLRELWSMAAHVLWDYSAMHLRLLASGLLHPGIELPTSTPSPTLVFDAELND